MPLPLIEYQSEDGQWAIQVPIQGTTSEPFVRDFDGWVSGVSFGFGSSAPYVDVTFHPCAGHTEILGDFDHCDSLMRTPSYQGYDSTYTRRIGSSETSFQGFSAVEEDFIMKLEGEGKGDELRAYDSIEATMRVNVRDGTYRVSASASLGEFRLEYLWQIVRSFRVLN